MKIRRTFVIGVLGAVLAVAIERASGWLAVQDADLCRLVGAALSSRGSAAAVLIGCVAQFAVALIAAYVYAFIFEHVFHRAGLLCGLLVGVAHAIVAGLMIGMLPTDPLLHADIIPPGPFMQERGLIVMTGFVLAHLTFGAFLGATYGSTRARPALAADRQDER